jgi:diguanylate cyclase (GGDEF)-like protein/PAS domain S-box-containing protein
MPASSDEGRSAGHQQRSTESRCASQPALSECASTIRRLRESLADERQALAESLADLRARSADLAVATARLRRTGRDLQAGHPPVSLLLDNVHDLVFRRAYRESARRGSQPPILLFYGADVSAILGHAHRERQLSLEQWYRRVHIRDRAAYCEAERRRETLGRGYTIEYRYRHAFSREFRWARETAGTPYDTASGQRLFDSYILDITEQKRAGEALRASEERYRAVVEDQSEYIRRFDRGRRLTFVNGALCRLLDKSRQDLLGVDFLEVMPEAGPETVERRLRSLTAAHPAVSYEFEVALPDGSRRWQEWIDRALFDQAGRVREYQSVGRDITKRKHAEQRARYLAQHDPLTDLPNRALLEEHLGHVLGQARRDRRRVGVLLLDLDGFKRINDTLGHLSGDRLLRAVGERLRHSVRASDLVARLGGDEFAVVQAAIDDLHGAAVLASKLIETLARPFELGGEPTHLGASGGVAMFPDHGTTAEALIRAADVALYRAKDESRNTFRLFTPEMEAKASQRLSLERDFRVALERGELELFYQPRIDLRELRQVGVEALVRWRRPGHGIVLPDAFLGIAEAIGLGQKLDSWVIQQACTQAALWQQAGLTSKVAVNISAGQTGQPQLASVLTQALRRAALDATSLELEISEHAIIDAGSEATIACLRQVADLGISLAIDDFGSGLSSFAYLRHLPVHTIKIDRSFVAGIGQNRDDEVIIKAIIELSHALGKRVVAEGVETKPQLEFLRGQSCDEAQGFLLAPPLAAGEVTHRLARRAILGHPRLEDDPIEPAVNGASLAASLSAALQPSPVAEISRRP